MPLTNAERRRFWRERHRGEPRGNKAMMAQLAALMTPVYLPFPVRSPVTSNGAGHGPDRLRAR